MASDGSDADSGIEAGGLGTVATPGSGAKRGKRHKSFNEALEMFGRDSDAEDADGEVGATKRQKKAKKEKKEKKEKKGKENKENKEKKERPPKSDVEKKKGAAALKKQLLEKKDAAPPPREADEEEDIAPAKKRGPGRGPKKPRDPAAEAEAAERRARKKEERAAAADGADEDDTGARRRGGARAPRGRGRAKSESESEFEVTGDELRRWSTDLDARMDAGSTNACTAFSIKEVPAAAIRRLGASSFLGKRKLEEGGMLLFDEEGKANAHFLLGTFAALGRLQQRSSEGPRTAVEEEDFRYLRWLVRKARTLRVVGRSEIKRGKVLAKRIVAAKRRGVFSLALESNLIDGREEEAPDALGGDAAAVEAKFPERKSSTQDLGAQQERLRSHIATRQRAVNATTSHGVDLQKARELIQAPSLSFDWDIKEEKDDLGGLEVDIPDTGKVDSRRDLFREQLHRSISANQAKGLARLERGASTLSRGVSSQSLGAAEQQPTPQAQPKTQPPQQPQQLEKKSSSLAARVHAKQGAAEEPGEAEPSVVEAAAAAETPAAPALPTPVEPPADRPTPTPTPTQTASLCEASVDSAPAPVETAAAPAVEEALPPPATRGPARDMALTQEFPDDISPTNMWSDRAFAQRESCLAGGASLDREGQRESSQISPTVPFVPMEAPAALEISPTVPFVSMEVPEISPTMPFVAAAPEISPTMPFVAELALSPTQPFVAMAPEPAEAAPEPAEAAAEAPRGEGRKRPAEELGVDAASDSDSLDVDFEGAVGEEEGVLPEDRKRREEDRAWKRQQRRRLLDEENRRRQQEARMERQQRRAGPAQILGKAAMTSEDVARFEDVIASAWAPQKVQAAAGLQALAMGKSDDAELLGGFRKAAQRRPNFLLGRAAASA